MYNLDATDGYSTQAVVRVLSAVAPFVWDLSEWNYANVLRADKASKASDEEPTSVVDNAGNLENGDDVEYKELGQAFDDNMRTQTADDGSTEEAPHEAFDVAAPDIGRADEDLINISIPEVIPVDGTNYSVNEVGAGAFTNLGIETLIVSSGIETIGKSAFASCWRLNSVELPTSLRTIEVGAFDGTYNLKSLVIPEGVKTIGNYAFRSCNSLQKLELPSTLDSIGNEAFTYTNSLSSVISNSTLPAL
jgi:hypothetical protein